jgi:hypothetical protein
MLQDASIYSAKHMIFLPDGFSEVKSYKVKKCENKWLVETCWHRDTPSYNSVRSLHIHLHLCRDHHQHPACNFDSEFCTALTALWCIATVP